jgi:hypothetical protein
LVFASVELLLDLLQVVKLPGSLVVLAAGAVEPEDDEEANAGNSKPSRSFQY